jgi:hypothetical protein
VLEPQTPAIAGAATLVCTLWSVDLLVASKAASPAIVLAAPALAAVLFALAFALWCPFRGARELMHELVSDWSPDAARWIWRDVSPASTPVKPTRTGSPVPAVPSNADAGTP